MFSFFVLRLRLRLRLRKSVSEELRRKKLVFKRITGEGDINMSVGDCEGE